MNVVITEEAMDVLSTDCAHLWKKDDRMGGGLGSWISDQVLSQSLATKGNSRTLPLTLKNGVSAVVTIVDDYEVRIESITYTPLGGVKITKKISFGRKGVSYFVNSMEHENGKVTWELNKVEFPSRALETIGLTWEEVSSLFKLNDENNAGMELCERLLLVG